MLSGMFRMTTVPRVDGAFWHKGAIFAILDEALLTHGRVAKWQTR